MSLKAHPCSSRSLQIVADILVDTLQQHNTDRALPCPLLLATALNFFVYRDDVRTQRMRQIRTQHPDMIRALFRFIMQPRSAEERKNLAAIRAPEHGDCACARDNYGRNSFLRELHDEEGMKELTGEGVATRDRSALQIILCELADYLRLTISFACEDTRPIRKVMTRARRDRAWPLDLQDVFLFGIPESMTSVCDWVEHSLGDTQVVSLATILQYTVLRTPFLGHFARTIISRALLPGLACKLRLLEQKTHEVETDEGVDAVYNVLISISCIASHALKDIFSLHNRQLRAAMIDDLHSLSHLEQLCSDVYHQLDITLLQYPSLRTDWSTTIQKSFLECHIRLRLLSDPTSTLRDPPSTDAALVRIQAKSSAHPIQQLADYELFRDSPICANPGCDHTRLSLGARLRVCGGCDYVSYCSRECQRAAWRHVRFPHRGVCAKIDSVMEEVRLAREMGGPELTSAAINDEDAEQVLCHLEAIYLGPESIP